MNAVKNEKVRFLDMGTGKGYIAFLMFLSLQ
jgi:hypothetical protein